MITQPSSKKIWQAILLIVALFGLISGGIAFLFNLFFKVGTGFNVFLITFSSSIIALLMVLWIIYRGFKKVIGGSNPNMMNFGQQMGGNFNQFNNDNK